MHHAPPGDYRRWRMVLGGVTLLVVLLAVTVVVLVRRAVQPDGHAAAAKRPGAAESAVASGDARSAPPRRAPTALQTPVDPSPATKAPGIPVRVSVPRLSIVSGLEPLGLDRDGALQAPSKSDTAGWYDAGPRPGAVGPALIAGHVDSDSGPAVFFHLQEVRSGDDVEVQDRAGRVRHFTVTDIKRYHKSAFPTLLVYGPTPLPVLRLVTCTGAFDASSHSYVDNLVVSTILRQAPAG